MLQNILENTNTVLGMTFNGENETSIIALLLIFASSYDRTTRLVFNNLF
jgi:hypothetical protein